MRVPESLAGLLDQGIVQEIVRPLMSGKEAQVYLVVAGGQPRVAKIYKDAQHRSFKQRAEYTEGRRVRSSRDQRAMQKRTRYGRKQDEAAWKSAEVDMIYRLRYAGVRVPEPYTFIDGVLLMELVQDADGMPAPRLAEVDFERDEARAIYDLLLREVVKMLCAGVVHGDLSEYNVLLAERGPVIIDFPQSVDAAANQSAKKLLLRDVDNLARFLTRFDHRARRAPYGQEIWAAYERNRLTPEMPLTGNFRRAATRTDTSSLLEEIEAAERDERRARGLPPRRREVTIQPSAPSRGRRDERGGRGQERGPDQRGRAQQRGEQRGKQRGAAAPAQQQPGDQRGTPRGAASSAQQRGNTAAQQRGDQRGNPRGAASSAQQRGMPAAQQRGDRGAPEQQRGERRGAPEQRGDQRGVATSVIAPGAALVEEPRDTASQEGAPTRRRRRRRKKHPADGPNAPAHQSSAPHGGASSPRVEPRSDASPPRGAANVARASSDERRGPREQTSTNGSTDAPPKRRRRRRRRAQPSDSPPGGAE